ncbi:MAG: FtsB family cell division protein [Vicinamibacterales bacterium]
MRRHHSRSGSILAISFGVCVLLGSLGNNGIPALLKARAEAHHLARDLAALRAENASLRARAEQLRSDRATIEDVARKTLGMARPDELVVTIHPASAALP